MICKSPVIFSPWMYTRISGLFSKTNNSDVPEKFSICASDYSRHEFQVLLSSMSTSFGLPNAEWKEFDVWTARPCITRLQQFFGNGVAGNNPINIWQMLLQTTLPWNHTSHTQVYFNEFVANTLCDNIGIVILTSEVMEAVRGQTHSSRRTPWHFNSMLILASALKVS